MIIAWGEPAPAPTCVNRAGVDIPASEHRTVIVPYMLPGGQKAPGLLVFCISCGRLWMEES